MASRPLSSGVFENVMEGTFSARDLKLHDGDLCEWRRRVIRVPVGFSRDAAQGWLSGHHAWR
jgi:hypothetical protein